jgi:hypothetical protein
MTVKIRAELGNALVVRPGDKLVIGTGFITQQHAAQIKERVAEGLPGVDAVIIAGIEHMAVYRPDEQQSHLNAKGCTIHLNDDCLCD